MERINRLLEKYFNAETTLQEEKELRNYFLGQEIQKELMPYKALFAGFAAEKEIKAETHPAITPTLTARKPKFTGWKMLIYSGVAASILAVTWFTLPTFNSHSDTYAIVNGAKITDEAYAGQLAEKKLQQVHNVLQNSMQTLKSIETVKNTLQPMEKLSETRNQITDLRNKLQIK